MSLKPHLTQWAAQFAVASELCKRGYNVGFTMGANTPLADLFVIAPKTQTTFLIDVKGQQSKSFWRIKGKVARSDLFYVLAYVPVGGTNRYFVMSQAALGGKMDAYEKSGVKYDPHFSGINWATPHVFENKWDCLPE